MAAQTSRAWTWVVLFDRCDPLLEQRMAVFAAAAPTFVPMLWTPPEKPTGAPWARHRGTGTLIQGIAAAAYHAPWREAMGDPSGFVLMTRLDDDDGLAVDALARYQDAAGKVRKRRTILMLPSGVRVWRSRYADVQHRRNAMHTLITPPGDRITVYDYGHASCHRAAPIVEVDQQWGWLWVRHRDTISGWKRADVPITPAVRSAFPIDWPALREAWA
jgi:hypothetical protein